MQRKTLHATLQLYLISFIDKSSPDIVEVGVLVSTAVVAVGPGERTPEAGPAAHWLDAPAGAERGVGGRAAERGRGELRSPGVCLVRPRHPSAAE